MKTNYLFFAVFLCIAQTAFAQNDTVVGILLDVNNKAIKKYPVTLGKVSPVTVKTDKKGVFTFANANLQDTLFVGDKKGKNAIAIPIRGNNFLSIKSQKGNFNSDYSSDEIEQLKDYFRQLQQNHLLTNDKNTALNTIKREDVDNSKCLSIECLIARLSGVVITGNAVRLSGGAISLTQSANSALIILDGADVGYSLSAINYINPDDIENLYTSKNGDMYGVRGAAGVLVVNTKRR